MKQALLIAATALLGACVSPAPAPPPAPPPVVVVESKPAEIAPEVRDVLGLLEYSQQLGGMTADELKREYQTLSQTYARDRSDESRLRLALLLSLPGPWRDDARLVPLLEGSSSRAEAADSPRRQFADLLLRMAQERAREAKRLEAQVKEEQRRADEAQRRAEETQRRADELQQKLDAMLNIERNLQRGRR